MPEIYCPNCMKARKIALVLTTGENAGLTCPRCHRLYPLDGKEVTSNIKTASPYGGGGSAQTPGAPGGSPFGSGGNNGSGINPRSTDEGLNSVIERTHQGVVDSDMAHDETMNIEKRLNPSHAYAEEDAIPYDLSHEERKRLRLLKEVQRREKFYNDALRSVDQNSVPYIKKHFLPKPEHMVSREDTLEQRRRNTNVKNPLEDTLPPQVKPERVHSILSSTRYSAMMNRFTDPFNVELDEDEGGEDGDRFDKKRMTEDYMGNSTTVMSNDDLERNLGLENTNNWSGAGGGMQTDGPNTNTLMGTYAEEPGIHPAADSDPTPSPRDGLENNPNLGTQVKLDALHKSKPQGSPKDPNVPRSWDEVNRGESRGVADKYNLQDTSLRTPYSPHI